MGKKMAAADNADEYERLHAEWISLSKRATAALRTSAHGNSIYIFRELEAQAAEIVQRMKKLGDTA